MADQKGYSMIILIIAILAISAITFGAIKIYKDKIEVNMPDIFKNSELALEKNDIEGQVAGQELTKIEDLISQPQEPQTESTTKTSSCKTEANQNTRQYLKDYEEQLKANWPNYLGATYDDFIKLYSDSSGNKYVSDPQTRISMAETALKSAQKTIQEKLSEVQAAVYPQYLQECLNK
jgi:hypothetical protein